MLPRRTPSNALELIERAQEKEAEHYRGFREAYSTKSSQICQALYRMQ